MDFYYIIVIHILFLPDALIEIGLGKELIRVFHQKLKDAVLLGSKYYFPVTYKDLLKFLVDLKVLMT